MKTTDWIMLFALSLVWGGSFFFNEIALQDFPVFTVVAIRVALAALFLWLVVILTGTALPKTGQHWAWFLIMSFLNNVIPFSLIVYGQTEITAGLASILNATTPFFIVLVIAMFIKGETISRAKLVALTIGFSGVVLILGPDIADTQIANLSGQIAVLVAALSYAFAGIFGRRFQSAGIVPIAAAAGQVSMSALILIPVALFIDGSDALIAASANGWAAVAGLATLSTGIAYILYFRILNSAGAVNLMLVTFLMPVTALLLGTFVLDEPIRPLEIAGMAVIGIALLIIDGRLLKKK